MFCSSVFMISWPDNLWFIILSRYHICRIACYKKNACNLVERDQTKYGRYFEESINRSSWTDFRYLNGMMAFYNKLFIATTNWTFVLGGVMQLPSPNGHEQMEAVDPLARQATGGGGPISKTQPLFFYYRQTNCTHPALKSTDLALRTN